jgi:hypothetical protein
MAWLDTSITQSVQPFSSIAAKISFSRASGGVVYPVWKLPAPSLHSTVVMYPHFLPGQAFMKAAAIHVHVVLPLVPVKPQIFNPAPPTTPQSAF